MNKETSWTVVINVHLPVLLMGYLIKSLLATAGSLSNSITGPPCQNLYHGPSHSLPHSKHVSCVSYDICVSGSCDGMLLARYFSAGAPCWHTSISQSSRCRGGATCHRRRKTGRSRVKVQGTMVKELQGIYKAAFHHHKSHRAYAGGKNSRLKELTAVSTCLSSSPSSSSSVSDWGRSCLYLETAPETSQMQLSGSV